MSLIGGSTVSMYVPLHMAGVYSGTSEQGTLWGVVERLSLSQRVPYRRFHCIPANEAIFPCHACSLCIVNAENKLTETCTCAVETVLTL